MNHLNHLGPFPGQSCAQAGTQRPRGDKIILPLRKPFHAVPSGSPHSRRIRGDDTFEFGDMLNLAPMRATGPREARPERKLQRGPRGKQRHALRTGSPLARE